MNSYQLLICRYLESNSKNQNWSYILEGNRWKVYGWKSNTWKEGNQTKWSVLSKNLLICSSTKLGGWELATALYQLTLSPIIGHPLPPGGNFWLLFPTFFLFSYTNFARKMMNKSVGIMKSQALENISPIFHPRKKRDRGKKVEGKWNMKRNMIIWSIYIWI